MNQYNSIILVGAGKIGAIALNFFGYKNVYCFADNYKANKRYKEKNVISIKDLQHIKDKYDIVLCVGEEFYNEMSMQLTQMGVSFKNYVDCWADYKEKTFHNPQIERWKNAYAGKKCFVIGNGPSLQVCDLEKLKECGYMSFGSNYINRIFEKTSWRPDFYCCVEDAIMVLNKNFIFNYPLKAKFLKYMQTYDLFDGFDGVPPDDLYIWLPGGAVEEVSEDLSKIVYEGHTVTFPMIEFAMYMGFKEIYLIGVDNTAPPTIHSDGYANDKVHFYEEDASEIEARRKMTQHRMFYTDDTKVYFEILNNHYAAANRYAKSHGIIIKNATRGGQLEVFERVNIDELLDVS